MVPLINTDMFFSWYTNPRLLFAQGRKKYKCSISSFIKKSGSVCCDVYMLLHKEQSCIMTVFKKVMIRRRAQKQTTCKTNDFISNTAISTFTAERQFPASISLIVTSRGAAPNI